MKIRFLLFPVLLLALIAVAPAKGMAELTCTQSMEITDPLYGVHAEVGVEVTFSDIGCAIVWRNLQCAMDQMEFDSSSTATDHASSSAIDLQNAFFVMGCKLETPMGYDIAAFKLREDAEAFAKDKEDCRVLTYNELIALELK